LRQRGGDKFNVTDVGAFCEFGKSRPRILQFPGMQDADTANQEKVPHGCCIKQIVMVGDLLFIGDPRCQGCSPSANRSEDDNSFHGLAFLLSLTILAGGEPAGLLRAP